jgi:hypothetical protein
MKQAFGYTKNMKIMFGNIWIISINHFEFKLRK